MKDLYRLENITLHASETYMYLKKKKKKIMGFVCVKSSIEKYKFCL